MPMRTNAATGSRRSAASWTRSSMLGLSTPVAKARPNCADSRPDSRDRICRRCQRIHGALKRPARSSEARRDTPARISDDSEITSMAPEKSR
ncbi:hypothetical protein [Roseateles chitinivorans]|uniref:hypothetical protein n=1 Tax=Roseateles chitinivorans TaxID=2917965 RepID=UPI003D666170